MKFYQISATLALLIAGVSAAPAPVAAANPENVDAGHFLEKAYVWSSYAKVDEENAVVEKREPDPEAKPENVDAGHFLEKAYVWSSYAKVDGDSD